MYSLFSNKYYRRRGILSFFPFTFFKEKIDYERRLLTLYYFISKLKSFTFPSFHAFLRGDDNFWMNLEIDVKNEDHLLYWVEGIFSRRKTMY